MGSSLPKGMKKQVIAPGDARRGVKRGDTVTVECEGSILDGAKFWSTKDPGQVPFTFPCGLGKVSHRSGTARLLPIQPYPAVM